MLRENYVKLAATAHVSGLRFLRDSAAALLPCCTLNFVGYAFGMQRVLTHAESLLGRAVMLSAGLLPESGVTKYASVIEARMRLCGVDLDGATTQKQIAAAAKKTVAPGTRGDIYEGLLRLSAEATGAADDFLAISDGISSSCKEGVMISAASVGIIAFLHRLCADYRAVCANLATGEEARLLRRTDACENFKRTLRYAAASQGADCLSASADTLAAMSSSGLIPNLPPVLFDVLLCYENLPPLVSGN